MNSKFMASEDTGAARKGSCCAFLLNYISRGRAFRGINIVSLNSIFINIHLIWGVERGDL